MPSNFSSIIVTWYDEYNGYSGSGTDNTSDVTANTLFKDPCTGEVNNLQIGLIARDGN